MKLFHRLFALTIMLTVFGYLPGVAQGGHHGGGHHGGGTSGGHGYCNPDSLILVTVSGTAMVDSSFMHTMYYLDEDGDGEADYHLNFGPWWYQPDSSDATRPNDGDAITIYGGQHDSMMGNLPVIIVYEINGLFWRDPFDPFWTHGGGHHGGGHHGGWMHDTLEVVTVNGTAIVDTTFFFAHYYLDEDNDGAPDYFLNFGPPWYEPPSGATRPNDGDPLDIIGGLVNHTTLPMIVVFEINGLVWRDTTGWIGPNPGGGWIHHNMTQAQQFHAPFDPEDWMHVNPGWHTGGMMMPESLFCGIEEIFPENLPNAGNENAFAAYEIGLFREDGSNFLWHQGGMGGHIQFGNAVQYQLHYNDIQLQGFNINENSIQVKYWNEQSNSWVEVSDATVDPLSNTVTLSSTTVSSHVMLTGNDNPLSVGTPGDAVPASFTLKQNYPNPFNPETTIEFTLAQDAHVALSIYNVLGQKLFDLVNGKKASGVYTVKVDGKDLPSGIYFYELNVDGRRQVRKMNLNK